MIYGGGMLELGQTFSLEQQVIDNDIIMMERKFMEGIPVTDETLAVDAIMVFPITSVADTLLIVPACHY